MKARLLPALDELVLLTLRMIGTSYGVEIHARLQPLVDVSVGVIYQVLKRLEVEGLMVSHLSDTSPKPGGRAVRLYTLVEPAAQNRLATAHANRQFLRVNTRNRRSNS